MPQSISFKDAAEIIQRHGREFGARGVVGVGIADRNDRLRFIVAVEDTKTQERLARQYANRKVDDFPVHVEVGRVESIGGLAVPSGVARPRVNLLQEIVDRPGIPLLVGIAAIAVLILVAAR
ncbi:MAG: hypothetical protein ACKVZJ_02230 [Phycisphaerales bacterium]